MMKKVWSKFDIDKFASSNKVTSNTSAHKQKTYLKCATLYVEVKEYKDALYYIQQYIKLVPKDYKGYKTLGYIQEQIGDAKEALSSYRRCAELNELDKESREAVSKLYCGSKDQLFRKRAWLEKMERDMPHSQETAALKYHVLQESGNIQDLEVYLAKQMQSNPHNPQTHIRLIHLLNKQKNVQEVFHYCSKINQTGAFYLHDDLLELSFKIMYKYLLSGNDIQYKGAEQIIRTCDWILSNAIKQNKEQPALKEAWRNYDTSLYLCAKHPNIITSKRWQELSRESLARLWLQLGKLVTDEQVRKACHILSLSAPSLPSHHTAVELSEHRLITAGIAFAKQRLLSSPTDLSAVLASHCSLTGQQAVLSAYAIRGTSYCMANPLLNVKLPDPVKDHTPSIIHYMRIRPLELGTLLFVLRTLAQIEDPVQIPLVVGNVFPKLKLHAQSLELIHTTDLAQDDVAALLHLLAQHPELETPDTQLFWKEICYSCKLVSTCGGRNASVLKNGLWSVRGLSNHGLAPRHAITLAKYFAHCAAINMNAERYRVRSSHYWKLSYNLINLIITRNYKSSKNAFFKYIRTEEEDLSELKEQSALAVAGAYVADGKYTQALDTYNSLKTPQAAYNASQVYLHLAECTNSPNSKTKYRDSAKEQLDVCRDRAELNQDQKILDILEVEEVEKMKFVTRRRNPHTELDERYEVCRDSPFCQLDSRAAKMDILNIVNDETLHSGTHSPVEVNKIRKQLDFSTQAGAGDETVSTQLHSLTLNYTELQQQLHNKDSIVCSLQDEISKLREEMQQLKTDVVMYSSPQQPAPDSIVATNNRSTPLWMRTDINHSPLTLSTPPIPLRTDIPPQIIGSDVPLSQVLPGHPGTRQPVYPAQHLIHSSRQLLHPPLPTPPLAQPIPPQPLAQSLAHSLQPLLHPAQSLLQPAQPLLQTTYSTPPLTISREPVSTGYEDSAVEPPCTVFNSSAIKFPDLETDSSLTGKFTTAPHSPVKDEMSPSLESPNIPGPGYFSRLLDLQPPEESTVDIGGYDSSEEKNDVLGFSQRFPAGAFMSAASSPEKLDKSQEGGEFVKQVDLEEVTEFHTGEEEEEAVYSCRAKLFRFAKEDEAWKERGTGELKLLQNLRAGTLRLVMRRDFVLNICANHYITPQTSLAPAIGSDKAWVWFTSADLANEVPEPQQLAARFKTKEIALEFKDALDKYKVSDSGDDIEIIYERTATAEQVEKARRYGLPDNFYLERGAGCAGCVGCCEGEEDSDDSEVVCVGEVLPTTPLKQQAALHQLPPSFYNPPRQSCTGCIGCEEEEEEVVFVKEILPATPLKQRAVDFQLPPSFYNAQQGCQGCIGCVQDDEVDESDEKDSLHSLYKGSLHITYEKKPSAPDRAAALKLPLNFFDCPEVACEGCLGCDIDEFVDIEEIKYEEEEEDNYIGCARSDPNEPVSEKPLYDALWPAEITEEDKEFFTPQKGDKTESDESILFETECILHCYSPRERVYVELGSGTLLLLSSSSRTQFRIHFTNQQQVLCASHAIEDGMYIECVPSSNKQQYIWFVPIDYTDPETPIPRKFMAQFGSSEAGEKWNSFFNQCSKDMKGHVVNHKQMSLLAAGSPKKEVKGTPSSASETPLKSPSAYKTPQKSDHGQSAEESEKADSRTAAQLDKSIEITREVLPLMALRTRETELKLPKGFYNYLNQPECVGCAGCEEEED